MAVRWLEGHFDDRQHRSTMRSQWILQLVMSSFGLQTRSRLDEPYWWWMVVHKVKVRGLGIAGCSRFPYRIIEASVSMKVDAGSSLHRQCLVFWFAVNRPGWQFSDAVGVLRRQFVFDGRQVLINRRQLPANRQLMLVCALPRFGPHSPRLFYFCA